MRAEDVVGDSFFVILVVGLVLIIFGSNRPKGSREYHRWLGLGLGVEGLAFFAFGLLSLCFTRLSSRPQIEGTISALTQFHGKYASSDFKVITDSGEAAQIHADYSGPRLRERDRARVRFIAYDRGLLEITLVSGPFQGWHHSESSGQLSCVGLSLMGLICWFAWYQEWCKMDQCVRGSRTTTMSKETRLPSRTSPR